MIQIVDHYPGRLLPTDRRGIPVNGYTEQDVRECTDPSGDLDDDSGAIALQEAVEAMQTAPAEHRFGEFPEALKDAVVDAAQEEDQFRRVGASPERIAAKTKKHLIKIGRLIMIHEIPYDEVIQGPRRDTERKVADLATSRDAAAARYDETLEREADKLGGDYNRARERLASKGILPPSE